MLDRWQQTGTMFKDSHPAPQPAVHLPHFHGDDTAADNDQRGGKLLEQQGTATGFQNCYDRANIIDLVNVMAFYVSFR